MGSALGEKVSGMTTMSDSFPIGIEERNASRSACDIKTEEEDIFAIVCTKDSDVISLGKGIF